MYAAALACGASHARTPCRSRHLELFVQQFRTELGRLVLFWPVSESSTDVFRWSSEHSLCKCNTISKMVTFDVKLGEKLYSIVTVGWNKRNYILWIGCSQLHSSTFPGLVDAAVCSLLGRRQPTNRRSRPLGVRLTIIFMELDVIINKPREFFIFSFC